MSRPTLSAHSPSLPLLLCLVLGDLACADIEYDPTDEDLVLRAGGRPTNAPGDPGGGVWVNNGLDDPSVSGIDPEFALSSPEGLSGDVGLLLDPDRQDTVQYLVECALPAGHEIIKEVDGELLTFEGWLGLAPEWEDEACDEDCQEWVSACLLARTNVTGQTVSIWMRADHPAIGEGMSLLYPGYEASFYGNLFEDPESEHFCKGTVVGPLLGQLAGRTCAGLLDEECGFTRYDTCKASARCSFPSKGLLGGLTPSPSNCIAGSTDTGKAFHTISTYVGLL